MFGGRTDMHSARNIIANAKDAGVNFIDTADVYNDGESERMVGALIQGDREHWVVATKVGNKMPGDDNSGGLSYRWINKAVDASRTRLGIDIIDIYYLHLDDYGPDQEETLRAVGKLLADNKIRYWGVSNFRAYRIVSLVLRAQAMGLPPPQACQPYYNALNRMPEVEILPACHEHGLGVVPYSPLARGVLTGKYAPGTPPAADSRAGQADKRIMETEFRRESLEIAQTIAAHARARRMSAGQWALNWVLANRLVTSVLVGPRTLQQWLEYLAACGQPWSGDEERFLDALVAPGHPSTPGYTDPKYPVRGRVAGEDTLLARV